MKSKGHLVVESILREFTLPEIAAASGVLGTAGAGVGAAYGALHYKRAISNLQKKYDAETDPIKKEKLKLKLNKLVAMGKRGYVGRKALIGGGIGAAALPVAIAPAMLSHGAQ